MLVFSGLGMVPTGPQVQCTALMDKWGYCGQSLNQSDPRFSGGGGVVRSSSFQTSGVFTQTGSGGSGMIISPAGSTPPNATPPVLVGNGGLPISGEILIPPAPGQQPPPVGLPQQPDLQPGTQVTNQGEVVMMPVPKISFVKLGLFALGAAIAGAGVGVAIHRRRARTAA